MLNNATTYSARPDRRQPLAGQSIQRLGSQHEAEQHCELLFKGFKDFRFTEPRSGTFLHTASIRSDEFRLASIYTCGHQIALSETDSCSVLIPLYGRIRVQADDQELEAQPGSGIVAMPGQRHTHLSPGYLGLAAFIQEPANRPAQQLIRPSPQLRALISYCTDACDSSSSLAANHSALRSMANLIGDLVAQSLTEPDSDASGVHFGGGNLMRHVIAAEDWIDAHIGENYPVSDLAAAVGLSMRSLQIAFRRHRGCSPRQAIERRRLERVRNELLTGPEGRNVTSIAMDNGVLHLGRFAASYRQFFGESPSDTLKRARD